MKNKNNIKMENSSNGQTEGAPTPFLYTEEENKFSQETKHTTDEEFKKISHKYAKAAAGIVDESDDESSSDDESDDGEQDLDKQINEMKQNKTIYTKKLNKEKKKRLKYINEMRSLSIDENKNSILINSLNIDIAQSDQSIKLIEQKINTFSINIEKQSREKTKIEKINEKKNREESYLDIKEEFEKIFCRCKSPLGYIQHTEELVRNPTTNKYSKKLKINHISSEMEVIKIASDMVDFSNFEIKRWFGDPSKLYVNQFLFNPQLDTGIVKIDGENYCNLFQGFNFKGDGELTEEDKINSEPFLELIRDLVGGDGSVDECFNYLMNYFASIIQKPWEKQRVCVILQGEEGCGKDTFFSIISRIIGNGFVNANNVKDFLGDFNGLIRDAIVVKCEELAFGDSINFIESFKSYITCDTIVINEKNEKRITLDSFHNYFASTNNQVPVLITPNDRRFVILKSAQKFMGNVDYFNSIYKLVGDDKIIASFARYLMNWKISESYNAFKSRPSTSIYNYARLSTRPQHADFLENFISGGIAERLSGEGMDKRFVKISGDDGSIASVKTTPSALMDVMTEQLGRFREVRKLTPTKFGRDLNMYPNDVLEQGKGSKGNRFYIIHFDKMKKFLHSKGWWSGFHDGDGVL